MSGMTLDQYQLDAAGFDIIPSLMNQLIVQMKKDGTLPREAAFSSTPEPGSIGEYVNAQYYLNGLTNEAGEVAGVFKKIQRDNGAVITPELREKLSKELGDVLWYASGFARVLGIRLSVVAENNIEKLSGRQERGTLGGSGDIR